MSFSGGDNLLLAAVATLGPDGKFMMDGNSSFPNSASLRSVEKAIQSILPQIDVVDHKKTFQHEKIHIHYKVFGECCYLVVAKPDYPMRICFEFLEAIQTNHTRTRTKNVKPLLKEKLAYFNNPENDRIINIKGKIDDVKQDMIVNIEKVLDRGEKLEVLNEKAEELEGEAFNFKRGAKKLKFTHIRTMIIMAMLIMVTLMMACCIICVFFAILLWVFCGIPWPDRCITPIVTVVNFIISVITQIKDLLFPPEKKTTFFF